MIRPADRIGVWAFCPDAEQGVKTALSCEYSNIHLIQAKTFNFYGVLSWLEFLIIVTSWLIFEMNWTELEQRHPLLHWIQ